MFHVINRPDLITQGSSNLMDIAFRHVANFLEWARYEDATVGVSNQDVS